MISQKVLVVQKYADFVIIYFYTFELFGIIN